MAFYNARIYSAINPSINILTIQVFVPRPAEIQPHPDLLNANLHFKRSPGFLCIHKHLHKHLKSADLHYLIIKNSILNIENTNFIIHVG